MKVEKTFSLTVVVAIAIISVAFCVNTYIDRTADTKIAYINHDCYENNSNHSTLTPMSENVQISLGANK